MNIAKFLRTALFREHLGWLLMTVIELPIPLTDQKLCETL